MSTQQQLFGLTYQKLLQEVVGGKDTKFQLLNPFMSWWWPTAPTGQISRQAYHFVNTMPSWSAVGTFSPTDATVFTSYSQVLSHANLKVSPDLEQKAKNAHDKLIEAQNQYTNDEKAANLQYSLYVKSLPVGVPAKEYDVWMNEHGHTATLEADRKEIAKRQETYNDIVGQQNPTYHKALAAVAPPESPDTPKAGWTAMDQGDGQLVSVPDWSIGESGRDWIDLLSQGTNPKKIVMDASESTFDFRDTWAKSSIEFNDPFLSVYVKGEWEEIALSTTDKTLSITAEFKSTDMVPVNPDEHWYNSGYLRDLARDPNAFNPPYQPTGGTSPIFGKNSLLQLRISELVVGYKPTIKIKMTSSTFNEHESKFKAATRIRIGPFSFSAEGDHQTGQVNWTQTAQDNEFTVTSNAEYPFILGVIVSEPGLN